ncbi:putative surface protease GP63, partial [Trypanosoma cruzi]
LFDFVVECTHSTFLCFAACFDRGHFNLLLLFSYSFGRVLFFLILVKALSFPSTYAMRQLFHVNPWLAALLVMFVIRLSSGCLVVTLTHSCSFLDDVVRTDGAWATPVVVRDVPLTAQDASRVCSVVCKKQWALARIKASTKIPDDSRRHCGLSWAPAMNSHLVAVLGLWLHIRTPQQGVAASTTETKTTSPLERVPRHARCGEVRRSACRLSGKSVRPFRSGHSVDITRGGDVHKSSGTEEDGYITVRRLSIAGLSSVKRLLLLCDGNCPNLTPFFCRK